MRKFSLTLGRFDGDGFSSAISNSKHRTRRFFFTAAEFRGPQFIANRFGATGLAALGLLGCRRNRKAVLGG